MCGRIEDGRGWCFGGAGGCQCRSRARPGGGAPRSAGFQPAVPPASSRQTGISVVRLADWKSATQQTGSLRYGDVFLRLVVAQVSNLPCRRLPAGSARAGHRLADWKSATQQTGSPRYVGVLPRLAVAPVSNRPCRRLRAGSAWQRVGGAPARGLEIRDTADWKSALHWAHFRSAGFQPAVPPASSRQTGGRGTGWRIGNPRHSRLEVRATSPG